MHVRSPIPYTKYVTWVINCPLSTVPWHPVPTVKELHREFLRAGSDVMQAFTFYASDAKLSCRSKETGIKYTVRQTPSSLAVSFQCRITCLYS